METPRTPTLAKDSDVLLEMESKAHGQRTSNLGQQFNSGGKDIHYVLVYERCEETENKHECSKEKAIEHDQKRKEFEKEIAGDGLEIEQDVVDLPGVSMILKKSNVLFRNFV